ncbi:hypothetical protein LOTGIDRAFT_121020 [Lottia gigantea]|uniref:Neurotransmitter-gated ion-channel ligand-binding domain-containing protein n=1 Tax=Lottia gigantea TaxID=225164 RepID=V4AG91_LOTGI|nr:hypothetical protein LOTGIDRAFT_121020 [Lottia gigantea]ESO92426.1 hypothetical protein LOTGIDRAFT_121020 [Lottia gigantea]
MITDVYGFNGCCDRPRHDYNQSITVQIEFGIITINGLDEKLQVMSLNGYLLVRWRDDFLWWNVSKYGPQRNIRADQIWTPDIMIYNAYNNFGKVELSPSKVKVYINGTVVWFPGGRYQVICKINIRLFPFDNQTCSILIGPWVDGFIRFDVIRQPFLLNFNFTDPEWILVKTDYVFVDYVVAFRFYLTRRYIFYVINIIVPLVILSLLTNLVFILPTESGEKVSLSISILLSYIVLMNLISTLLPTNSDQICLLSVYIMVLIVHSALSTIATVLELQLTYSKEKCCNQKPCGETNGGMKHHRPSHRKLNIIAFVISLSFTIIVNIVFYFLII